MCSVVLVALNNFEYRCKEIILFIIMGTCSLFCFNYRYLLLPTLELCMHAYDLFLFGRIE